jgi:hypothetical protein
MAVRGGDLAATARQLTGNRAEVIEVDEQEVRRRLHIGRSLWRDVREEGCDQPGDPRRS